MRTHHSHFSELPNGCVFAALIRVEGCTSTGHHTDERRIGTIRPLVDAVQTPIEIEENTLKPNEVSGRILTASKSMGRGRVEFMVSPIPRQQFKPLGAVATFFKLSVLLLPICTLPTSSYGRGPQQEQTKQALGSLTAVGEVYLNDDTAPRQSTIFTGDRVRTAEAGAAAFTMSGKGTMKISPQSEVLFSGSYQYTAELEAGTIVFNTTNGPSGFSVRIGNDVVVSYGQKQSATIQVTRAPNGSVFVSCVEGSAGVLTLDGQVGQFLQAGQSTNILGSSLLSSPGKESGSGVHSRWIFVGVAGAGAAAAIAFLTHGNAGQSISPSAP
jgi:hypothetical protein